MYVSMGATVGDTISAFVVILHHVPYFWHLVVLLRFGFSL